ncbi:MAG: DUF4105 domain-containing protein [Bacteroidales bacterium]
MNRLKLFVLLFFFLFQKYNPTLGQTLSEDSEITLITCNPGEELYSVFGHSAIRIHDKTKKIDWVYNYGTFNFDEPDFYVKFVRGYLNYQLSVYPMKYFMEEYQYENRSVFEQVLNLNQEEKNKIFKFLEYNRRPENKYYLYDFFFDNCATRVRDVYTNKLDSIHFNSQNYSSISFRSMLKPYLAKHYWSRFGINLVLGQIADRNSTLEESMFLPDYMKLAFDNAYIGNKKIVKNSRILFEQKPSDNSLPLYLRPGFVFIVILVIVVFLTILEYKQNRHFRVVDFLVFLVIGIIGMILFFMWFGTNHTAVVKNWNLMWAIPTHFLLSFFVFIKKKSAFLKYYFLIAGIVTILVLPFWPIIPQRFDYAIIPIILLSGLRSYQMYRFNK